VKTFFVRDCRTRSEYFVFVGDVLRVDLEVGDLHAVAMSLRKPISGRRSTRRSGTGANYKFHNTPSMREFSRLTILPSRMFSRMRIIMSSNRFTSTAATFSASEVVMSLLIEPFSITILKSEKKRDDGIVRHEDHDLLVTLEDVEGASL
jgi:hypothetical protein